MSELQDAISTTIWVVILYELLHPMLSDEESTYYDTALYLNREDAENFIDSLDKELYHAHIVSKKLN